MKWGVLAVVAIVVLVALLLMLWLRGRRLGMGGPATIGRIDLARGIPHTRGKGYAYTDVDDLLDRTYALATTPEGRVEALELLHTAQFELVRFGGYDPVVVDLHLDAMIVALQIGRELPPSPGSARP
ncbi:MAG: hypothetical protein LCH96_06750 [Actinobacteria bacterium]|nr:hypothetical protein [Actinomycetota bacterium]